MAIWVIADLHLSFGAPDKKMDVFGPKWAGYTDQIKTHWLDSVSAEDLVLIPGDISWAMSLDRAQIDLEWIEALPGTKVIIKGNHDYWWGSYAKVKQMLPPTIHAIQNNAFEWKGVSIGGARLWDSEEYDFNPFIDFTEPPPLLSKEKLLDRQKLFNRELERLELSLKELDQEASMRIVMTHYPPIGADLKTSRAAALLEKYKVQICVFGHLHNVKEGSLSFGQTRGVRYFLTSCDFLNFRPLKIV
ncbi:MAG: metallophosphoesterase [Chlamydiales bacterium]